MKATYIKKANMLRDTSVQDGMAQAKDFTRCSDECKDLWSDGQELTEGIDFAICTHYEVKHLNQYQYPTACPIKNNDVVEDQDKLWEEVRMIADENLSEELTSFSSWERIKSRFTITRKS